MCSPPRLLPLPTQSDQHGRTQAANKTRIRRVSTHTLGCSEKVSEHAQSRPPPLTHFFSFITPFCLSFLPSFSRSLFISFTPVFSPSSASSFQTPRPVSSRHNGASRNYSFCWGSSEKNLNAPCSPPPHTWGPVSCPVMIMKCAPSQ